MAPENASEAGEAAAHVVEAPPDAGELPEAPGTVDEPVAASADEPEVAEPEVTEPEVDPASDDVETAVAAPRRRRTSVRRGLIAVGVALVVALALSAFATVGPAAADADQRFVDTARSQGHVVAGGDQSALLVSAAHKICGRRESHTTAEERRATALSTDELVAVQQAFADDVRGFTALALDTYCPS